MDGLLTSGEDFATYKRALTQRVAVERAFWFCFHLVKCREKFINAFLNNQNPPPERFAGRFVHLGKRLTCRFQSLYCFRERLVFLKFRIRMNVSLR